MALVYKAEQDEPRRIVALKIPRGGKLLSREARDRFLREVRLATGMDHAGIVPVLEAGEMDGAPYYTMPFIEGRSLAEHIVAEKPDLDRRAALFLRVCDVVQSLHAAGLVHRDLKPENIMVDCHGDVRILDFGLARAADDAEPLTGDQTLLGSLQCMAPEQTLGVRDLTPAADVYALGMILYRLLTDQFPYLADGSREDVLRTIRECAVRPPSQVASGISKAWDELLAACLQKDPGRRPRTAGEVAEMVRTVKEGRRLPPQPPSAGLRALVWISILTGFLLVVAAGVFAWRHTRPRPSPETATPDQATPVASLSVRPQVAVPVVPNRETAVPLTAGTAITTEFFTAERIRALASGLTETTGSSAIPRELWPVWQQALSSLRDDFAHRKHGAILVRMPGTAGSAAQLAWRCAGESAARTAEVESGGAAILYAPADAEVVMECILGGHVVRQTFTPSLGEVRYVEFKPGL
jgi:serine/threonine protein kinase